MGKYVNLGPGSTVPKKVKYKCEFCGEGGIADSLAKAGLFTRGLEKQESVRFFVAGKKFTECPNCGPGTGWTLVEEGLSSVQPSQPRHDEAVSESCACDICGRRVSSPDGYLLTTREVVSTPKYWQHYYQHHKSEFVSMGVSSYEDFCRNPLLRESCGETLAGQRTPWMVCENCISMFDVDREKACSYAKQGWESRRTFQPPGTGPAPLSAINMGDARATFSIAERGECLGPMPRKKWWEFWKIKKKGTNFADRELLVALTVKECLAQGIEGEDYYRSMARLGVNATEADELRKKFMIVVEYLSDTKVPTRTGRAMYITGVSNEDKLEVDTKGYTKDHHLNKIEDIDTKEALELLLRELESKRPTTQKYFYGNIAVMKNGNKWMHIVAQPTSFSIILYGSFNEDDLKEFQTISTNARLESYGINLKVEKPSQTEGLLKLIL